MPLEIPADFPTKLLFLLAPAPGKILHGGRGGMKTYSIADALLISGLAQFERVLCARETMHSLAESVHYTLEQRIYALGLKEYYKIQQGTIIGPTWGDGERTEFIFAGLHHNVANIKSLEGVTKCWVEEAQSVSQHSWDTLLPTLRWEKYGRFPEVWVSYNPELATDATHKLMMNPPPGWIVCKTTYHENPWLPANLRAQAEHMQKTDPAKYAHIWLGECVSAVEGAIYAGEIAQAEKDGRVCLVPYDRTKPVHTFWDLGFGDKMCIVFAQAIDGWYNLIDFMSGAQQPLSYYMVEMQRKPYVYGTHWLPHDGVDAMTHHKLAGETGDKSRSPEMLMRQAGLRVRIAPKMEVFSGINAARTIFPQCRFDKDKCDELLTNLRHYAMGPDTALGQERRKPLHDLHSHGADAFRTMAVGIKQPAMIPVKAAPAKVAQGDYGWMASLLLCAFPLLDQLKELL